MIFSKEIYEKDTGNFADYFKFNGKKLCMCTWMELHSDRSFGNGLTYRKPYFEIIPYYMNEDAYLVHKVNKVFTYTKPIIGKPFRFNAYLLHGLLPKNIAISLEGLPRPSSAYKKWWKGLAQGNFYITDKPKLIWEFIE